MRPLTWAQKEVGLHHGIVLTVGCLTSQRHCSNPLWLTCLTPMTIYQTQTCLTAQASQSLHHHHKNHLEVKMAGLTITSREILKF